MGKKKIKKYYKFTSVSIIEAYTQEEAEDIFADEEACDFATNADIQEFNSLDEAYKN